MRRRYPFFKEQSNRKTLIKMFSDRQEKLKVYKDKYESEIYFSCGLGVQRRIPDPVITGSNPVEGEIHHSKHDKSVNNMCFATLMIDTFLSASRILVRNQGSGFRA